MNLIFIYTIIYSNLVPK